ncbi:proline-rich receptor-like protein kinase PERK2 [Drosophila novamexicana]|uniref:proline-rich receptor-like protein kinase PERK2 n=1 Tax=Drosophila novamexicana TaxID=47314 RepID=UPI0011E5A8A9|nr:proline-rich receptor-like protein kinase PERK2 [Drosophila novamexicana]
MGILPCALQWQPSQTAAAPGKAPKMDYLGTVRSSSNPYVLPSSSNCCNNSVNPPASATGCCQDCRCCRQSYEHLPVPRMQQPPQTPAPPPPRPPPLVLPLAFHCHYPPPVPALPSLPQPPISGPLPPRAPPTPPPRIVLPLKAVAAAAIRAHQQNGKLPRNLPALRAMEMALRTNSFAKTGGGIQPMEEADNSDSEMEYMIPLHSE